MSILLSTVNPIPSQATGLRFTFECCACLHKFNIDVVSDAEVVNFIDSIEMGQPNKPIKCKECEVTF